MQEPFDELHFTDGRRAQQALEVVLECAPQHFAGALATELHHAASPQKALERAARFLEALDEPHLEVAAWAADPAYLHLLLTILTQSHHFADQLCATPQDAWWLRDEAPLDRARPREEMANVLRDTVPPAAGWDEVCRALRRFRQRELLRIAVRDVVGHATIHSLTEDLSNLADAAVQVALEAAHARQATRLGQATGIGQATRLGQAEALPPFVVLGVGKLGGCELNFSSDIDLLFVYGEGGEAPGRTSVPEYFQRLGELIIEALSKQTVDGHVFRVDMRLRPHGRMGPLSVRFESALEYYATYGRAWERQAMIKARPCAGDLKLGETFIERLRPFVFPRYFDDDTLEDIRDVKRQTEAQVTKRGQDETEVKLGRGGIRDIEFTVQMLQLLEGGRVPELRTRSTLTAIEELGRRHRLRPFEAQALASNYNFLRRVEHRLQIDGAQQVHALPQDPGALDELARRLGYEDGPCFLNIYRDRAQETRAILDRFLSTEGAGNLWVGDLLDPNSDGEAGREALAARGFQNCDAAREELLTLAVGTPQAPYSQHIRQRFREIAPALLEALAATPQPDRALGQIARLFTSVRATGALYDLLKYTPELVDYLVALVINSDYLTQYLVRDPGLLDLVGTASALDEPATPEGLRAQLARLQRAYDRDAALYRLRDGELLRTGMRELARGLSVAKVGDALSYLADVVVEAALEEVRSEMAKRYDGGRFPFAVLGVGKLGGWEMGYGSDLDLLFLYDSEAHLASGESMQQAADNLGSRLINRLKQATRYGTLYDVDARLRPDGNKGPLAAGTRRFDQYYREEAQAWERFAMMKVRAIAGDADFLARCERMAKDIAFNAPFSEADLDQVERLRAQHVEKGGRLHLKYAPGGISDIELAVRFWQVRHAEALPAVRRGDVFGVLDIFEAEGIAGGDARDVLRHAYNGQRQVLNRLRMRDGSSIAQLPDAEEERQELAARLGITGDLLAHVEELRASVLPVYQAALAEARALATH